MSTSTSQMIAEALQKMGVWVTVIYPLVGLNTHRWGVAIGGLVVGLGCVVLGVVFERLRSRPVR